MAPRPGSAPGRARACRHSDRSITLRALHAGTAGQRVIRRAGDDRRARHRRGRSKRVRRRGRAHGRPRGAGRLPDHRRGDDARQQTPRAMPARAPGPPMNAKGPGNRAQRSTATGIRTRVSAMRGRRPSPLDDSGAKSAGPEASKARAGPVAQGRRAGRPPCGHAGARPARTSRLRYLRIPHADVAELVDAHGSGPCRGNPVEVRVLSSALAGFSAVRRAIGALPRCDAPSGRPLVGDIASGFSTQQHAA